MNVRVLSRISLGFGIALLVSALFGTLLVGGAAAAIQALLGLVAIAFFFGANKGALGRTVAGRGTLFYGVSALTGLLLVAVLAGANYVAVRKKVSWDLTDAGLFTLAPDTLQTLRGLEEEVKVTAFYAGADPAYGPVKDLLDRYAAESGRFVVEFVDPDAAPKLVSEKGIKLGGPRVVLARGKVEAKVSEPTEEALTNALLKVLRDGEKKLYLTSGHGERALDDATERGFTQMVEALGDEGLAVEKLSLTTGEIPADAAALLILDPKLPFFEPELESLGKWLEGGGRLFVALEPGFEDPGLEKLLAGYGTSFEQALVVDPLSRLMGGGTALPVVQTYADHEIIRDFALTSVFPTARPVRASGEAVELALSNPSAWGETDLENPQARADEGERRGALGLMAAVSAKKGEKEVRIVAAGDADFASNRFAATAGNGDLFLNSINWLVSQESRITIRPRFREGSRLVLTESDARFLNLFSMSVLPMLVLGAGLSVWLVRRAK